MYTLSFEILHKKSYTHTTNQNKQNIFRWSDKVHVKQCNLNADAITFIMLRCLTKHQACYHIHSFFSLMSALPELLSFSSLFLFTTTLYFCFILLTFKQNKNNFIIYTLASLKCVHYDYYRRKWPSHPCFFFVFVPLP